MLAHDVERVLADIDTNHGKCTVQCLGHGVFHKLDETIRGHVFCSWVE